MATVVVKHHSSGGPADPLALVDGPTYDNDPHIVTGLENVPNVDTTNASNISSGSLAVARMPVVTIRKPASAASITITTSDIEVGLDTRSTAVTANLPSVASWAAANPSQLLTLLDYYGNASINNVTPAVNGGDSFNWGGLTPKILGNFGILRLRPDSSANAWMVYHAS